jgi:hypothetical protein
MHCVFLTSVYCVYPMGMNEHKPLKICSRIELAKVAMSNVSVMPNSYKNQSSQSNWFECLLARRHRTQISVLNDH